MSLERPLPQELVAKGDEVERASRRAARLHELAHKAQSMVHVFASEEVTAMHNAAKAADDNAAQLAADLQQSLQVYQKLVLQLEDALEQRRLICQEYGEDIERDEGLKKVIALHDQHYNKELQEAKAQIGVGPVGASTASISCSSVDDKDAAGRGECPRA